MNKLKKCFEAAGIGFIYDKQVLNVAGMKAEIEKELARDDIFTPDQIQVLEEVSKLQENYDPPEPDPNYMDRIELLNISEYDFEPNNSTKLKL